MDRWQSVHGYQCAIQPTPEIEKCLLKLHNPRLEAIIREGSLDELFNLPAKADTPFDRVKAYYYGVETYSARLIRAMVGESCMPMHTGIGNDNAEER
jgi:hypothetical protein